MGERWKWQRSSLTENPSPASSDEMHESILHELTFTAAPSAPPEK